MSKVHLQATGCIRIGFDGEDVESFFEHVQRPLPHVCANIDDPILVAPWTKVMESIATA